MTKLMIKELAPSAIQSALRADHDVVTIKPSGKGHLVLHSLCCSSVVDVLARLERFESQQRESAAVATWGHLPLYSAP